MYTNYTCLVTFDLCNSKIILKYIYFLSFVSDVFLGPVNDYVIAPVARYSGVWGIPVITARAQVYSFSYKGDYPTLTRMMGSYRMLGEALHYILNEFGWSVASIVFFNHHQDSSKGNSKCFFMMSAVFQALGKQPVHRSFNESADFEEYKRLLKDVSKTARSKYIPFVIIYRSFSSWNLVGSWRFFSLL